jgi:tetratricopeptide (TPR) repeat protein
MLDVDPETDTPELETQNSKLETPSFGRRLLARWWYIWAQSLTYWGHQLVSRRLYDSAVDAYGRVLISSPGHAQAYLRRGALKGRELQDYVGAVEDLSAAIALRPDWPEPYLQRGLFHRFHGPATASLAVADLRRFLELSGPSSWRAEAERQIAMLEAEHGQRPEALP